MSLDLISLNLDDAEVADVLIAAAPTADERRQMAKSGVAMKDGSYYIRNADDLSNAIRAVGRGSGSHDAIRAHIIKRAKALGLQKQIPDNWTSGGAMKASADEVIEENSLVDLQVRTELARRTLKADATQLNGLCDLLESALASAAGLNDTAATLAAAIRTSYNAEEVSEGDAPIMAAAVPPAVDQQQPPLWTEEELTAAAMLEAPSEAFEMAEPDEPTPLTITEDGRVFGHAAIWGTCHTGIAGKCTTPPRSPSNYSGFHLGQVDTVDGQKIAVGKITLDTGHAPSFGGASASAAHYDNTGSQAAYIRARDGKHGIWFSGVLNPNLAPEKLHELKAGTVSGDWRKLNGALEMIGLLAVNVPGFPIPRPQTVMTASVTAEGEMEDELETMLAAGIVDPAVEGPEEELDELTIRMRSRAAA